MQHNMRTHHMSRLQVHKSLVRTAAFMPLERAGRRICTTRRGVQASGDQSLFGGKDKLWALVQNATPKSSGNARGELHTSARNCLRNQLMASFGAPHVFPSMPRHLNPDYVSPPPPSRTETSNPHRALSLTIAWLRHGGETRKVP